jgi:gas vesicle protein
MGHHSHSTDDNPKLAGVAIISALVGALTALVFAPRTGSQTRQEIRNRVASTKEDIKTHLKASRDVATDEAKNAAELVDDAVMLGKEHIHGAAKDVKRTLHPPNKGESEDTTDDIRKHGER